MNAPFATKNHSQFFFTKCRIVATLTALRVPTGFLQQNSLTFPVME